MSSIGDNERVIALVREVGLSLQGVPEGPLGVAFSGGPDSVALAILLREARGRGGGEVLLFHIEHNLRGAEAAAADKSTVTELAGALLLPLRSAEIEPGAVAAAAERLGVSVEAAARKMRYELLGTLCVEEKAKALLTAHHRDDQLETVLLELIHGAPETAWGGMAKRRDLSLPSGEKVPLLRPLLGVRRTELESVVSTEGVTPIRDPSNREVEYERNFLRLEVIPALRRMNRRTEDGVLLSAARLRSVARDIEKRAAQIPFRRAKGRVVTEARGFFSAPPEVRAAALELEGRRRGVTFPGRSRRFLEPLLEEPPPESLFDYAESRVLAEGGSHRFTLHRGRILWQHDIVPSRYFGYLHEVDSSPLEIRWLGGVWTTTISSGGRRQTVVSLPTGSLKPPVLVRSRRAGDRLLLKEGPRLLKGLYDRYSVPQVVRENIPIIEDRGGILALPSDIFGFPRLQREGLSAEGTALEIRFFVHGDFV